MPVKFLVDHPNVRAIELNNDQLVDKLPAQVYTVAFHSMMGFSLTINKEILKLPKRIYGDASKRTEQCIKTYSDRSTSTGVLLTGDKGTGKTLQMALLANEVIKQLDLPVILIKEPYAGSQFSSFIEDLGECCLVFDEFAKLYSKNNKLSHDDDSRDTASQNSLLSLMDGVDKTKRLIILTENDKWDINEFMLNRPSRIYYHFEYSKLPEDSIMDYCTDKKINIEVTKDIIDLARKSEIFSFDILQTLVEEHKRFGTKIEDTLKDLNIEVKEKDTNLQIKKLIDRKTNEEVQLHGSSIVKYNGYDFRVMYKLSPKETKKQTELEEALDIPSSSREFAQTYFTEEHLAYQSGNTRIFENDEFTAVTEEIKTQQSNYMNLL